MLLFMITIITARPRRTGSEATRSALSRAVQAAKAAPGAREASRRPPLRAAPGRGPAAFAVRGYNRCKSFILSTYDRLLGRQPCLRS